MKELYYDLHIHSCLSPCGDKDMTPANIVGMAAVNNLDVIAITDHNSCRNCGPAIKLGEEYGVIVIPGMELCTQEEVHVLCLFGQLKDAMSFSDYVYKRLIKVYNNEDIFGTQEIYGEEDHIIDYEPYLLINATDISFEQAYDVITEYNGIMIPAHINKGSNSLYSNLGFMPPDVKFKTVEYSNENERAKYLEMYPYLREYNSIINSDAHYLEHIHRCENVISCKSNTIKDILKVISGIG